MLLVEPVETINKQLTREYGVFTDGRPKFRVVWSEDQYEKKFCFHTKDGFELIQPVLLELPKYKPQVSERFVLEQLSVVPESDKELTENLSYEPIWVFQDRHQSYLPPQYVACKLVVDQLYQNIDDGKKKIKKYTDPNELKTEVDRIDEMEKILFGEETPVGDALRHGYGVVVPENKLLSGDKPETNKTVH